MDKITSKNYNLQTIIKKGFSFNIPRYQRLFVWKEEQVHTLFNDILTAWLSGKKFYYIGGIITVKYEKIDNCFDLVDGQQRFTTLWLLASELGGELDAFTKRGDELRLNFSIRKNVIDFFNKILRQSEFDTSKTEFDDLVRIAKTKRTLNSLIGKYLKTEQEKQKFADFVLNKLKMVITNVPEETDLNKLFETLNNRGVQLSQHEILKANLLSKIKNKETRYLYNALWSACSDMYDYIERNLAREVGKAKEVAATYDWYKVDNEWRQSHDWNAVKDLIKRNKHEKNKLLNLKDILRKRKDFELENNSDGLDIFHPDAGADEYEKVRSILSFPQLLLHTLRIYLYKNERSDIQRINEKELIDIFNKYFFIEKDESEQQKASKAFIELLVKVREVFDKYVIKWVEENENTEIHLIKVVKKQNQKKRGWTYFLRRQKNKELDGLALLQSILYHSQQNTTQYWLTPYLYFVLDYPKFELAYIDLKKTDNVLFSSNERDDKSLPERTWACMDDFPEEELLCGILNEKLGTNFPHYWFYKMEFVLWHEREMFDKKVEWEDYTMTARNSVEHISPQSPRNQSDKLCKTEVNAWGNLVLVTRSINSEYSDLPYSVKKAKFDDKKAKGSLDSLKSDLIYAYPEWGDTKALDHQKRMIDLMKNYFEKISNE
jgi:uncharacterized protein with ParB-like and HNH nuclease domain